MCEAEQRIVPLAEDDVSVRNLVRHTLQQFGFVVLAAADAGEALAISQAYPDRIHILLTDVDMPGMNGIGLAENITHERCETAVLLMSGGPTQITRKQEWAFLQKPFGPEQLIQKLEELIAAQCDQSRRSDAGLAT